MPFANGETIQFAVCDLESPDRHYLNAASGWLELGDAVEARAEIAKISPTNRSHPATLELNWRICAHEKDWRAGLEVASEFVRVHPDDPTGWIHQSYCLHELKRTREARALLLPVAKRFQRLSTIPYNLACYACQLGDLDEARTWLVRAIDIRGKSDIKKIALEDADLKPLWQEIMGM